MCSPTALKGATCAACIKRNTSLTGSSVYRQSPSTTVPKKNLKRVQFGATTERLIQEDRPTDVECAALWYSVQETQDFRALARGVGSGHVKLDETVDSRRGLESPFLRCSRRQSYVAYVLHVQAESQSHNSIQDPVGLGVLACALSRPAVESARHLGDKDAMEALAIHEENNLKAVDRRSFFSQRCAMEAAKGDKLIRPRRKNAVARQA